VLRCRCPPLVTTPAGPADEDPRGGSTPARAQSFSDGCHFHHATLLSLGFFTSPAPSFTACHFSPLSLDIHAIVVFVSTTTRWGAAWLVRSCSARKVPTSFRASAGRNLTNSFQLLPPSMDKWADPASVVTRIRSAPPAQLQVARQKSSCWLMASPCQAPALWPAGPRPRQPSRHLASHVRLELPSQATWRTAEANLKPFREMLSASCEEDEDEDEGCAEPRAKADNKTTAEQKGASRSTIILCMEAPRGLWLRVYGRAGAFLAW